MCAIQLLDVAVVMVVPWQKRSYGWYLRWYKKQLYGLTVQTTAPVVQGGVEQSDNTMRWVCRSKQCSRKAAARQEALEILSHLKDRGATWECRFRSRLLSWPASNLMGKVSFQDAKFEQWPAVVSGKLRGLSTATHGPEA
eukprot:s8980_g2.t1